MSRFVKVPQENGDIVLVNTDSIEEVSFEPNQDKPMVCMFLVGTDGERSYDAVFDTDAEAIDFIEKNFILFNS